jgi:D-beta-D-heptose 7-phosphate kinase/D-beta-D-heptose 1-phosphate adenosyltransferase
MKKESVLVIGDVMLDRHIYGKTDRVSPEAPVPIVSFDSEEWVLGAAANTAAHITSAGVECFLAFKGIFEGGDNWSRFYNLCSDKNILLRPLRTQGAEVMTVKTRVWSHGQQICRIDEEDVSKPAENVENAWCEVITSVLEKVSVVIFSDYDKGSLTDSFINKITAECHKRGIYTVLDPKRPSFPFLKNLDVVKPNRRELSSTNLTPEQCSVKLGNCWLIHTLAENGMSVYNNGNLKLHKPTVAEEVVDSCGCGDTVSATIGLSILFNDDLKIGPVEMIQNAVVAANKAASFTIRHRGSYILTKKEMMEALNA